MRSLSIINRRARAVFAAAILVFGTLIPSLVSAATVTSRSIALSSSVKGTASVTYKVVFTSPSSTKDFVLDFCDSAALGTTCNTPSGFDASSIATATSGYSVTSNDTNTATVTLTSAGTSVDVELSGITNPTNAGVIYARITTYAGTSDYSSATALGTVQDDGGVAINITDGFGVSGRVAETMLFCASGSASAIGTGCSTNVTSPNLTLGTNGVLSTTLSEGTIKTQISTNAANGAVVYLKSDAAGCGGLVREGTGTVASRCNITPVTGSAAAIANGTAKFGLRIGNLGGTGSTTARAGSYDATNFFLNYVNGDASGVTGPYGDQIYTTGNAPINDGTADLTFGAAISGLTPAGNYKASMNLIATGTF